MSFITRILPALSVFTLTCTSTCLAQALTDQQIKAIQIIENAANDICYSVSQGGTESQAKIKGEIDAGLKATVAKVLGLGIAGSGSLENDKYEGVVRDQLAAAIAHSADCKQDVFHTLVDKVFPTLATSIPVAPGLPSTNELPTPDSVTMTETTQTYVSATNGLGFGPFRFALYNCALWKSLITCLVAASFDGMGDIDYRVEFGDSIGTARFVDNFGVEHQESKAYFINGRGQHQQTVNLEKGVPMWLALEFEGPADGVKSGRIVFSDHRAILHVRSVAQ